MKFLLVKLNHIGDTLLLTPTLRWLRQQYPEAMIDVVVRKGTEAMLAANPDIDHIITVARPERHQRRLPQQIKEGWQSLRAVFGKRYDYAFDLTNSDRAKILMLAAIARHRAINDWHLNLGWKRRLFNRFSHFAWGMEHQVLKDFHTVTDALGVSAKPGPLVLKSISDLNTVAQKLPQLDHSQPYVILHPISRWSFKEWQAERWAAYIDWLHHTFNYQVILSCGPDPKEQMRISAIEQACLTPVINSQGRLNLDELTTLLKSARFYVGIDTAIMHMAAAVQTPCLVLFGPSSEWSWHPWQCHYELVLGPCECKKTRRFSCDRSRIYPCMEAIQLTAVQDATQRLLETQP